MGDKFTELSEEGLFDVGVGVEEEGLFAAAGAPEELLLYGEQDQLQLGQLGVRLDLSDCEDVRPGEQFYWQAVLGQG